MSYTVILKLSSIEYKALLTSNFKTTFLKWVFVTFLVLGGNTLNNLKPKFCQVLNALDERQKLPYLLQIYVKIQLLR